MIHVVGSYLSPYVRKVLAALHVKGLAYDIDPIVPFFGGDSFTAISPLRRVPVLIDEGVAIADSTVILEYLEDRYPHTPLYPADPAARAHARWIEEFANSRIGDVFIWKLFNQRIINPGVWRKPTDEAVVTEALATAIPAIMDYLEATAPAAGFLFGAPGVADIAVAAFFRNARFAGWTPDAGVWPRAAAWVERTLALDAFARLAPYEVLCMKTPPPAQRDALRAAGAPISAETVGTTTPTKGTTSV